MHVAAGVIFGIQQVMVLLAEDLNGEADLVRQFPLRHVDDFNTEQLFGFLGNDDPFARLERCARRRFLAVPVPIVFSVGLLLSMIVAVSLPIAATDQERGRQEQRWKKRDGAEWIHFGSSVVVRASGNGKPVSSSSCAAASSASFLVSSRPSTASRYCFCNST